MVTISEEEFLSYKQERFKEHPQHKGIYVGTAGTILSTRKGRQHMDPYGAEPHLVKIYDVKGYLHTGRYGLVHRLVAEVWLPNPDNLPEVNHKDEDKSNNCVDNLEWCTHKYNMNYGTRIARVSEKLKIALKGKPKSAETRAKISAANKGKPKSAEHRAKLSAANKGKHWKLVDGKCLYYNE